MLKRSRDITTEKGDNEKKLLKKLTNVKGKIIVKKLTAVTKNTGKQACLKKNHFKKDEKKRRAWQK